MSWVAGMGFPWPEEVFEGRMGMTIEELKNFLKHPYDKIKTREGYTVDVVHPFIALAPEILALVEAVKLAREVWYESGVLNAGMDGALDAFNAKLEAL